MNSRAIPISDFIAGKWDLLPQSTQLPEPDNWDTDIAGIEDCLKNTSLPVGIVKLNAWTTITDARLFVAGHLATVKHYHGNRYFLPYLHRLQEFINQLNIKMT